MSGTVLIDLSASGDLQNFLDVNGSHDVAFDSKGVIAPGSFTAYPWGTSSWKNVDEKKRRAPSAILTEEWLKVIETCHGRNSLAASHDVLSSWELPDGSAAGTLTAGGTQFDAHVWCKRSWWKHVVEQRYCIDRAIAAGNLYDTETLSSLADAYLNGGIWTASGSPPAAQGIGPGKFTWHLGWRSLLFPWSPVTTYHSTSIVYGWERRKGVDLGTPYDADIFYTPNASSPMPWFLPPESGFPVFGNSTTGVAGHAHQDLGGGEVDEAWWYIILNATELLCSSGTTVTRPASSLRNIFGFGSGLDEPFARLRLTNKRDSASGGSHDCHLFFLWYDNDSFPAPLPGSGSIATNWIVRDDIQNRMIDLGSLDDAAETNIDLSDILDVEWDVRSASQGRRIPLFIIGPPWEHELGSFNSGGIVRGAVQTDSASTAGCNHLIPWLATTAPWDMSIGTSMYPFR